MSKKKDKNTYWKDLKEATQTTTKGMSLTWEHFQNSIKSLAKTEKNHSGSANSAQNQSFDKDNISNLGVVTNRYPHEMMPIPDNGRYKLHNEIDDCIVCNKCVEVCPVNCIEIDAIRGTEQVGRASDGSPIRFYAAKFDIDMAKCCFCGLCTVVCPTECLTMTKEFDFSETDISKMNYEFGNLTEKEATQKQKEWDNFQAQKEAEKAAKKAVKTTISKPLPKIKKTEITQKEEIENKEKAIKKPAIKIKKIVPQSKTEKPQTEETTNKEESQTAKKIIIKPKLKPIKIKLSPPKAQSTTNQNEKNLKQEVKKTIKIKIPKSKMEGENNDSATEKTTKPIIKIKIPKTKTESKNNNLDTETE